MVEGVGDQSLQGDADFYKLLERMGCGVTVTHNTTTVLAREQGSKLKSVHIDMEHLTDAFMTACVLAAVAVGTSTQIVGIANQRVKECNRIAAMVKEFSRLGVKAQELEDGIEVFGMDPSNIRGACVHCYDDHRIAMVCMSLVEVICVVCFLSLSFFFFVDTIHSITSSHMCMFFVLFFKELCCARLCGARYCDRRQGVRGQDLSRVLGADCSGVWHAVRHHGQQH
jgi:EPSP synthase (3-phosphoshikimate 1-carboxyvinyltransferase)